jgi:glutamate-1-semialdehyde 2,1-aminomutase
MFQDYASVLYASGAVALVALLRRLQMRLELSAAKHPSLAGHARMSRFVAGLVPHYEYDEDTFFRADDAPPDVAAQRQTGFMRLAARFGERYPKSSALTREIEDGVSDLQFISRYRVPFQFRGLVRRHFAGAHPPKAGLGSNMRIQPLETRERRARSRVRPCLSLSFLYLSFFSRSLRSQSSP